jgi:hypothetical protein
MRVRFTPGAPNVGRWRNAYASVLETDAFGIESSSLSRPTIDSLTCGRYGQMVAQQSRKLPHPKGHRSSNLLPSAKFCINVLHQRVLHQCRSAARMSVSKTEDLGSSPSTGAIRRRGRRQASSLLTSQASEMARRGSTPRPSARFRASCGHGRPRGAVNAVLLRRRGSNPRVPTKIWLTNFAGVAQSAGGDSLKSSAVRVRIAPPAPCGADAIGRHR